MTSAAAMENSPAIIQDVLLQYSKDSAACRYDLRKTFLLFHCGHLTSQRNSSWKAANLSQPKRHDVRRKERLESWAASIQ